MSMFCNKKIDCWLRGVKLLLITDHESLTFLINKRMDEMKPAMARKVIFLNNMILISFTKMEIQ